MPLSRRCLLSQVQMALGAFAAAALLGTDLCDGSILARLQPCQAVWPTHWFCWSALRGGGRLEAGGLAATQLMRIKTDTVDVNTILSFQNVSPKKINPQTPLLCLSGTASKFTYSNDGLFLN